MTDDRGMRTFSRGDGGAERFDAREAHFAVWPKFSTSAHAASDVRVMLEAEVVTSATRDSTLARADSAALPLRPARLAEYTPFVKFEWDATKARANLRKHKVSFDEAVTVFGDGLSLTIPDEAHSEGERRFLILGVSNRGRILVVPHTFQRDTVRIISARRADRDERNAYEENS